VLTEPPDNDLNYIAEGQAPYPSQIGGIAVDLEAFSVRVSPNSLRDEEAVFYSAAGDWINLIEVEYTLGLCGTCPHGCDK